MLLGRDANFSERRVLPQARNPPVPSLAQGLLFRSGSRLPPQRRGLAADQKQTIALADLIKTQLARSFSPELENAGYGDKLPQVFQQMLSVAHNQPDLVHPSWKSFLTSLQHASSSSKPLSDALAAIRGDEALDESVTSSRSPPHSPRGHHLSNAVKAVSMIRFFQKNGHFLANLDPLGLPREPPHITTARHNTINMSSVGNLDEFQFTPDDLNDTVQIGLPDTGGFLGVWKLSEEDRMRKWAGKYLSTAPEAATHPLTIGQLHKRLQDVYSGPIGVEFMHLHDREKINWIRNHFETPTPITFSKDMKLNILESTMRSVLFEKFAAQKFATMKRFGLDGCESLIVGMRNLVKLAVLLGVDSVVITMSHRGRLNTLTNVMHKPAVQVFSEFSGVTTFGGTDWGNSGDVKYHLGVEYEYRDDETNKAVLMTVIPNPSHLESSTPVLLGTAKARQISKGNGTLGQKRVLPINIHGDAAMAGQGVVYESVQMTDLPDYSVGGTIHVVVNNQIGFTTPPSMGSSGNYCTDVAKTVQAPVFHVNADDPEAVTFVMEVAAKFRQKFLSDVFVDIVGYRRFGHNELDMPKFTNPVMYNLIDSHENVLDIYSKKLIEEGTILKTELDQKRENLLKYYDDKYKKAKAYRAHFSLRPFSPQWHKMATPDQVCAPRLTGVQVDVLKQIGKDICEVPKAFNLHPTVARVYKQRLEALSSENGIDFGLAEALAVGTLLRDGTRVRLAGQDCQRGTFSHRHAVLHDQKSGAAYTPLQELVKLRNLKETFEIVNSPLSEFASLGFEYGYSLETPNWLNIWEAQFGDFANGGQVIVDQYITSGEVKWNQPSGLVLMLPHGYDGQGPEHSSGRIERYLTLCDDREDIISPEFWKVNERSVIQKHNVQVCNVSTAAQLFHVLRRQIHRGFRKPLVLFNSKKLLRLKGATSPLSDFTSGTRFARYIEDPIYKPASKEITTEIGRGVGSQTTTDESSLKSRDRVERLVICSGQLYYDLEKAREDKKLEDRLMIARVEQLSPFPLDRLTDDVMALPNLKSIVWAQEEPMNQGPWSYASDRIRSVIRHCGYPNKIEDVIYAGRDSAASTATGDPKIHHQELIQLCDDAMDLTRTKNSYYEKYDAHPV